MGKVVLVVALICALFLAWFYRANWVPTNMSGWNTAPSATLMASGGVVCVAGVKGASVNRAPVGEDGCAKGLNVAPGRPVVIAAGKSQATLTFKTWGETLPLPGFAPEPLPTTTGGAAASAPVSGGPTPWPQPTDAGQTGAATPAARAAAEAGPTDLAGSSKTQAPSWATATCPSGQKTIWISESGVVTSDVEGYTRVFGWQKNAAIAVKGGDGKFHVGKRIAPGVWCTQ